MKLVIQRVERAEVLRVSDNKIVGKIGLGLFVLVGFKKGDSEKDAETLAVKLSKLRIMADEQGEGYSPERSRRMNLSINDVKGKILVVSQFTLYANTKDGNRPSFIDAEDPEKAKKLYDYFIEKLREQKIDIETGSFGDYMKINTELDGPVTIVYETS